MSSFGLAVIADTATASDAAGMVENVHRAAAAAGVSAGEVLVEPVRRVGDWWRVCAYLPSASSGATDLFTGVRTARVAAADDFDEHGCAWTTWRITDSVPELVYRKFLPPPGTLPQECDDAADDRADRPATLAMAQLWDANPGRVIAVERRFEEMSDNRGEAGTPFLPWITALGLWWPGDRYVPEELRDPVDS
ncbi:hypothetical protein [Nocardia sp. NPDC057668]|uniref:hypothetical protein n=1 Tax=Nocardia sp. NPDC057668 TaxID=3346202 RepID=UPI00366B74B5